MLRLRTAILAAAFLLAGCDHHKPMNQAQSEAGSAAVANNDSDLTGLPPQPANVTYPRATLVTLPPSESTPVATPSDAASPSTETNITAPIAPPPDRAPPEKPATADASSSLPPASVTSTTSTDDSVPSRLTITNANPVVITNPAPVVSDATVEEQVVVLDTSFGRIVIELDDNAAPKTCGNFRKLVSDGFYNHTTFHRIIPDFIIQGGDPNSKSDDRSTYGQGGPGYTVPAEIKLRHDRGAVAMARLPDSVNPQRESNGCQFYICLEDCPSLDDNYTVFGHVIKGLDIAEKIANQPRDPKDNPLSRIEMNAGFQSKDKALQDSPSGNL